jgi:hypothetical protein
MTDSQFLYVDGYILLNGNLCTSIIMAEDNGDSVVNEGFYALSSNYELYKMDYLTGEYKKIDKLSISE